MSNDNRKFQKTFGNKFRGKGKNRLRELDLTQQMEKAKKAKSEFFEKHGETFKIYIYKRSLAKVTDKEFEDLRLKKYLNGKENKNKYHGKIL